MSYVYAPLENEPQEITLRELSRRLTRDGKTSPPDFIAMDDEALRRTRLAEYDTFPLTVDPDPDFDRATQELGPAEIVRHPTRGWVKRRPIRTLTPEEITFRENARAARIRQAIENDMRDYADPIFMKYQAGEATREEWLAARQMVRDWYADNN
jgi:hypothetical protein